MKPEKLTRRIIADAHAESRTLREQAEARAQARRTALKRQARARAAERLEKEQSAVARAQGQVLAGARIESGRSLLALKRELLERFTSGALSRLNRDRFFLEDFYRRGLRRLEPGKYRLEAAASLAELLPEKWWRENSSPAGGVEIDFAGFPEGIDRGVVLSGKNVEIRLSPERILELERAEVEKRLARTLLALEKKGNSDG